MRISWILMFGWLCGGALVASVRAAEPTAANRSAPVRHSVLSAEQVVQILDDTLDWYRTLGAQQQSATQPSDLLILYANRQTADQVIGLAFDIARANAELLSSEVDESGGRASGESSGDVAALQKKADERRRGILSEMDAARRKPELAAKLSELQGELDMVNAQKNLLDTIGQFASENDARRAGVTALKAHIDAIAASIPNASATSASARGAPGSPAAANAPPASAASANAPQPRSFGLWDLSAEALRLSCSAAVRRSIGTIEAIDRRTAALQDTFARMRANPVAQLEA